MTIIVVIANRSPDIVSRASQTSGIGHVGKSAVAVVAEEAIAEFGRVLFECGNVGAIGKENVWPAVAVVVEDGNAAQHGFRQVFRGRYTIFQAERNLSHVKLDGAVGLPISCE